MFQKSTLSEEMAYKCMYTFQMACYPNACAGYINYSRTSITRTSLGAWKFVRGIGSSSH